MTARWSRELEAWENERRAAKSPQRLDRELGIVVLVLTSLMLGWVLGLVILA